MDRVINSFEDKVAVITGATGGLGSVVTRQLAKLGANVVLVGTTPEKLDLLGNALELPGEKWLSIAADLTTKEGAQEILNAVMNKFGRVDILIHLIGGWIGGKPLSQVQAEDVEDMLKQHVWSTFYVAQAIVPKLIENNWGRIIVVSSPHAVRPPAKGLPYSVAKSGQEALILTLAEELRDTGVTANILHVRTIDVKHAKESNPSSANASWTTPEEIVAAILYLCSDEARTVNGARLPLYGSP